MSEYIKREHVLKLFGDCGMGSTIVAYLMDKTRNIPAADVVERKRGEWVTDDGLYLTEEPLDFVRCSLCGKVHPEWGYNFCPYCGADMRPTQANDSNALDALKRGDE